MYQHVTQEHHKPLYWSPSDHWAGTPAFVPERLTHTARPANPPVELKRSNNITNTYLYALLVVFNSTFKLEIFCL